MRVNMSLEQHDLLTNKKSTLAKGKGILKGNELTYFEECDGKNVKHEVIFAEDTCMFKLFGDVKSMVELKKDGTGVASVDSVYGVMQLKASVQELQKEEGKWLVTYSILDGTKVVLKQRLEWKFVPLS